MQRVMRGNKPCCSCTLSKSFQFYLVGVWLFKECLCTDTATNGDCAFTKHEIIWCQLKYDQQQGVFMNTTWIKPCGRHDVCCLRYMWWLCSHVYVVAILAQVEPTTCGQQMRIGGLADFSAHQILFVC